MSSDPNYEWRNGQWLPKLPSTSKPKKHGNRVSCAGGCGTFVLIEQGECRDCRRKRRLAGKRRVRKIEREGRQRLYKALDPIVDAYLHAPSEEVQA